MTDGSLIAAPVSTRNAWTGASLADSFQGLYQSVNGGMWVDRALAGGAFAVEVGATILDPFSALLSNVWAGRWSTSSPCARCSTSSPGSRTG